MRLRDLGGQFIKYETRIETYTRRLADGSTEEVTAPRVYHIYVDNLQDADGVMFLCPKCFASHGGPVGTHSVICWFEGRVPDDAEPGPGRWKPVGGGLDDLTFVPGRQSNSVRLLAGCQWHGFVTTGDVS